MIRSVKRHNLRWGFGFADTRLDSRTDSNARGTYYFTGAFAGGGTATGGQRHDFADFLLGYAADGDGSVRARAPNSSGRSR